MSNSSESWDHEPSDPEISIASPGSVRVTSEMEPVERAVVGERFGKYLIVGELAVGGMAEVFLGVQRGLEGFQKSVVIKRVLPAYNNNPEFVQMFVDEARLAARLEHPNIVRTYEFGEVGGQYFTVMEYLPGEDLVKTLNKLAFAKARMPLHLAAGIVSSVCEGLHFAHQLTDTSGRPLNLIHRDINPANVLVTYTGEVKIIDFGVAKTNASETQNGTIKGKVAYMSPEQLLGRGIDQRSDVFSAGVVLWELLVGRPLFLRDNEGATLYAIMNDPIRAPSRERPDVPRELDGIVMRALARTPADRYDTAEEMAMDLDRFLASQPKYDSRAVARMLEDLFGSPRAEAKRSIAQTRSLGRNISLVMKLRTDVRADLAEHLDSLAAGSSTATPEVAVEPEARRGLPLLLAFVMVLAIVAGVFFVVRGSSSEKEAVAKPIEHASLQVESDPAGAAISIDGEPTGLKTPATLNALTRKQVTIQLELAGHTTLTKTVDIPASGVITQKFSFEDKPESGRLVLANLPSGATIVVDGEEYQAGEVVDVSSGTHDIRVIVGGKTIVQQQLATKAGLQTWKLSSGRLVTN